MNDTYNRIKNEIYKVMQVLNISRMPSSKEVRGANDIVPGLDTLISRNGGYVFWAKEFRLKLKSEVTKEENYKSKIEERQVHKIKWTEKNIEDTIYDVMKGLIIDYMPGRSEILSYYHDYSLHNAISKHGGYRYWANKLSLEIKESETQLGQTIEDKIESQLISQGFEVKRMTTRHPFDILVNNTVKIDVKSGCAYDLRGSRCNTFGISKKYGSCDIYIIVALSENGEKIEKILVIPSHHLRVVTLSIGENSKYNKYKDRFDYITSYSDFMNKV